MQAIVMSQGDRQETAGAWQELEKLFWDNQAGVFRTAYRITGSTADAEDVLQTVFLRLLARGRDADLAPSPVGYLKRAAVNAALDAVRSRGIRRAVPLELVPPEGLRAAGVDPEQAQGDRETRERLRRALSRLHPRTSEVFVLRYVEGLSNSEIAALLDTSTAVVAVTLFRARRQVRRAFESERMRAS